MDLVRLVLAAREPLAEWARHAMHAAVQRAGDLWPQAEGVAMTEADLGPSGEVALASPAEPDPAADPSSAEPGPDLAHAGAADDTAADVPLIEQARRAAGSGDLAAAVSLVTLAIDQSPNDASLYVQRSAWRAGLYDFEHALADLERARALAPPGSVDVLFARLRVRVRFDNAPLVSPGKPVVRLAAGTELVVTQADGEWLYVTSDALGRLPGDRGELLAGWIDRDDVEAILP
jgi:hypothetical protein